MQKAFQKLQSLIKEATSRYGTLQATYDAEKSEQKEEIGRRNDAIRALKKELDDANVLIKTMQHKGDLVVFIQFKFA